MGNFLDIALQYHKAGIHVIPVREDKRPYGSWSRYQVAQTEQDVKDLFSVDVFGIAGITGVNGLQAVDIDMKYDLMGDLFNRYIKEIEQVSGVLITDFTVQLTPSGGYHLLFKSKEIEGNKKLASRPATDEELKEHNQKVSNHNQKLAKEQGEGKRQNEKFQNNITDGERLPKVLLETRGKFGYVLLSPTPKYEVINNSLLDIPTISTEKRKWILRCAESFNEVKRNEDLSYLDRKSENKKTDWDGKSSWDDYNEKIDFVSYLESYGWTYKSRISNNKRKFFLRPGETSSETSANYNVDLGLFKCFSTSTVFESEKAYTPFAVYTILEHDGDFQKAAATLYQKGYGERQEKNIKLKKSLSQLYGHQVKQKEKTEIIDKDIFQMARETKFDYDEEIVEDEACLVMKVDDETFKVAGFGMMGVVVGAQKSGKSLVTGCITASGISNGKTKLHFSLNMEQKKMISFDTEQSNFFYKITQKRNHDLAGVYGNSNLYDAFHLRKFSYKERQQIIKNFIYSEENLGFVLIDGIVDLVSDYNDLKESQQVVSDLLKWADETNTLILVVLHLTKTTGQMRGHLGTELQNKCDFAILIKKDEDAREGKDVYTVSCKESRFAPFPSFEFTRNEDGIPVGVDIDDLQTESISGYEEIKEQQRQQRENFLISSEHRPDEGGLLF